MPSWVKSLVFLLLSAFLQVACQDNTVTMDTSGSQNSLKSASFHFMKPPGWAQACLQYGTAEVAMAPAADGYYFCELTGVDGASFSFNSCDGNYRLDGSSLRGRDLWVYSDGRWYAEKPQLDQGQKFVVAPYPPQPGKALSISYNGEARQASLSINGLDYQEYLLDNGKFSLDLPQDTRALFIKFGLDDNFGEEYILSTTPLFIGPYLTFGDKEANSLIVHFVLDKPLAAKVQYGITRELGQETEAVFSERYHHQRLADLLPGTTYYYRVMREDGLYSATYTFTTPRKQDSPDFSFVVAGDMQDSGYQGRWGEVARNLLAQNGTFDFIISTGDLVMDSTTPGYWLFFDHGRELLARKVLMPVLGNHDSPTFGYTPDFFRFNNLFPPINGEAGNFYYFTYQNVLFLALNSSMEEDFVQGGRQYGFGQAVINSAFSLREPAFTFHFMHTPLYNAGARHGYEAALFRAMTAYWPGKVDWSFGGHEHLYQRFGVIAGTGYIAVPPAGNYPECGLLKNDHDGLAGLLQYPAWPVGNGLAQSENGFVVVKVDENSFKITSYGLGDWQNGRALHQIDSYTYTK